PRSKDNAPRPAGAGHLAGLQKNSRADHRADDDCRCGPSAERADQVQPFARFWWCSYDFAFSNKLTLRSRSDIIRTRLASRELTGNRAHSKRYDRADKDIPGP